MVCFVHSFLKDFVLEQSLKFDVPSLIVLLIAKGACLRKNPSWCKTGLIKSICFIWIMLVEWVWLFIELLFEQDDPSRAQKEKEELDHAIALSLAEDLKKRNRMIPYTEVGF